MFLEWMDSGWMDDMDGWMPFRTFTFWFLHPYMHLCLHPCMHSPIHASNKQQKERKRGETEESPCHLELSPKPCPNLKDGVDPSFHLVYLVALKKHQIWAPALASSFMYFLKSLQSPPGQKHKFYFIHKFPPLLTSNVPH